VPTKGFTNWVRLFTVAAPLVEGLACEVLVSAVLDVLLGAGAVDETLLSKTVLGPVLR